MAKTKSKQKLTFTINVPVFVTKRQSTGTMFEFTYEKLIEAAIELIQQYNKDEQFVILDKKNKFTQRQLGIINHKIIEVGDRPSLLLNVSAHTLNKKGEHIKNDGVVSIEPTDRLGDDSNYFLLIPQITGIETQYHNWLAFVYDDPTRETDEIITLLKVLMNNIIRQPIKNIKLPTFLEELREHKPNITLNLNTLNFDQNDTNDKFQQYIVDSKTVTKKETRYTGMPIEEIENLINDDYGKKFSQKILRFFVGKKEFKIKQEVDNFKTGMNLLVEQHFNFSEEFPNTFYDKIHDIEFIIATMKKVLNKHLTNGEE